MAVPPTNVLPIPIRRSGGDANVDIAGRQHRTPGPVGGDALSAPLRSERKSRLRDEGKQQQQLETDQIGDQMSLKEFIDPFTGSKNTKA